MATQKLRRSDIKKEIKRINFLKNNCPCFGGEEFLDNYLKSLNDALDKMATKKECQEANL